MYIGQGGSGSVLMVTSSIAGEGKSFVSLNTAHTLALTGKKVVLVEFDLRKPQFAHRLNIKRSPGITDYAITSDLHPEDIIQSHEQYENLSFICCGPIPPNPAELILTKRIDDLFRYLKENYDYIILDTPPVGIVSDAIIIGKWADLTLFIVRHRYSYRSSMQMLNDLYHNQKLPRLSLVINSIVRNKGFQKEIHDSYSYYQEDPKKEKSEALRISKKSSIIKE
jgi:capsular exopolysaccharide synthesis family protein